MPNGSLAGYTCLDSDLSSSFLTSEQPLRWKAAPSPLKILVTEDCDDSFALTELTLSAVFELTPFEEEASEGASRVPARRMLRAVDGDAALMLIQAHRFDLVFMDVHMPGMDGYEAIRHIRAWERHMGNGHMKIAVLSSDDPESQRASTAGCGCVGYLRKPLRDEELSDLLERLSQGEVVA